MSRANPEWAAWLALVAASLRASVDRPWSNLEAVLDPEWQPDTPLLQGATLVIDSAAAASWTRAFLKAAGECGAPATNALPETFVERVDALALLEAAACQDPDRMSEIARAGLAQFAPPDRRAEVSRPSQDGNDAPLAAIAQLAVRPLLLGCARQVERHARSYRERGWCPVCGAWAAIAEVRGLDRARCLRCARCGADWTVSWLSCPFCGERDHRQLGSLLPEQTGETRKVDTCTSCHGYIKTMTKLAASPPWAVALDDLESTDLDLAAIERGFARPDRVARLTRLRIVNAGTGAQ